MKKEDKWTGSGETRLAIMGDMPFWEKRFPSLRKKNNMVEKVDCLQDVLRQKVYPSLRRELLQKKEAS